MPKISIIVPVHNVQEYLHECLDSVLGQTLDGIEVICIDDKSDDASADILREYAKGDSRMRIITHTENMSASRARKDGVAAATAEYILFLDGDDALELDACERLYSSMEDNPVDILHFGTTVTNEADLPEATLHWLRGFVTPYDGALKGSEILEGAFSANRLYNFSLWDKLYSADLCKRSFARIGDGSFPKAQDKYAYFILSYFARTYRGMPDALLYVYHWGRGVTGHDQLTLPEFERVCAMARVADAIGDFLTEEGTLQQHLALYRNARSELLQDCVANWDTRLNTQDRAAGFELMLQYWEARELRAKIAEIVAPRISIVVPVHNMEKHLHECLGSAVGQTLLDVEVICIDDCSTDASADILHEYAERDPRVRVITYSENKSVSQARKDGVAAARGEYIMFLDADDALELDACKKLLTIMEADPVDILHFGTAITNETNLPQRRMGWLRQFVMPYDGELEDDAILAGAFSDERLYNFSLWDKLYSADLCKRSFARIKDGRFARGEDKYAYFVLCYLAQTYRGVPDEVLYRYNFGRGLTGHNLLSFAQFETTCSMARSADAIRDFLVEEDAFQRHEAIYAGVRDQLLVDCVSNWNRHLSTADKAAGFDLMLKYWDSAEIVAKIAQLNWTNQGHVARLLGDSRSLVREPRDVRVIGTYYHRFENGGAERILSILIKLWLGLGYEVVLFTDLPPSPDDYHLPEGVQRVIIPSFFETAPNNYLDRAREIERVIKHHNIDVMVYHSWVSPILLWDMLLCKLAGVAFVTHCHSVFSHLARCNSQYFADMPPVYGLSDSVVALSEVDRAYWGSFNGNVVPVVNPLTFDLNDLTPAPLDEKNVVWLGRLSGEKRPADALRIFAKVLDAEPDARLLMVGSSSDQKYTDDLAELIDELGIRDSVEMCGFQKDVLPFYRKASVLLMTSEFEGFSLVLSEAQSSGIPCVMYDLPYLTLTRDHRGLIAVEMGDRNAAADAVVDLLGDPDYRRSLGREARANVEELARFDFAGTWSGILGGLSQAAPVHPVDESTRIMWETLLDHYRTGVQAHGHEIYSRDKELAKRYELLQQRNKDLSAARAELKSTNLEMDKLKDSLTAARKAQKKLRSSRSFKIGYAITSIPRTIRRSLRGPGSREE